MDFANLASFQAIEFVSLSVKGMIIFKAFFIKHSYVVQEEQAEDYFQSQFPCSPLGTPGTMTQEERLAFLDSGFQTEAGEITHQEEML